MSDLETSDMLPSPSQEAEMSAYSFELLIVSYTPIDYAAAAKLPALTLHILPEVVVDSHYTPPVTIIYKVHCSDMLRHRKPKLVSHTDHCVVASHDL